LAVALGLLTGAFAGAPPVALADNVPVSIATVHGAFYSNPNNSGALDLSNLVTPVFTQDFPVVDFNPPASAQVSCSNSTGINENSRPFTDVIPNADGTCGTSVAQGGGQQAGVGNLFTFQAILTADLTVAASGQVTFNLYSDDGWMLGAGQRQGGTEQPTYVSGSNVSPLPSTPGQGFPVVGSYNIPSAPAQNTVTVSFTAAGTYPIEMDYTECCGGQLALVLGTTFGNPIPPNSSPTIASVNPNGGPWTGGQNVMVTGTNFANGDSLCFGTGSPSLFIAVTCASNTAIQSPSTLSATTPALSSLTLAGQMYLAIGRCCSGLNLVYYPSSVTYTYFVPEIGVLVFRSSPTTHDRCTASIVSSTNHSVVLTAGHCVGVGGTYFSDFAFAPGYFGPLCSEPQTGQSSANAFNCGAHPYGVWTSFAVMADPHWLKQGAHAVDFGFLDMRSQSGVTIGAKVGGGLVVTWKPGNDQTWDIFGQAGDALRSCTAQSTHFTAGDSVKYPELPDVMSVNSEACEAVLAGGASGGPWLNASNGESLGLGAVNSTSNCPNGPGSPGCGVGATGTYMGQQAHDIWRAMQSRLS
jgi:hypothetical protein